MTQDISRLERSIAIRHAAPGKRLLIGLLAVVGAIALAVQLWGYVAWMLSPNFATISSSEPPPSEIVANVVTAQVVSVVGTVLWLSYIAWNYFRRRELTWPILWTVAWAAALWQEPLVNARTHTFSFNKEFVNWGDWTPYLPFVDGSMPLPEAILLEGLVFVYLLPLLAMGTAALMKALRGYLRVNSPVVLVLVAWLAVAMFDMTFERTGIAQGLLCYAEVGGPAFNKGEPNQWPIFEGLAIGLAWAVPGMVLFFRRDRQQELAPRWWSGRYSTLVTLLAAIGLVNLAFGLYNAGYIAIMHGTVVEMPPWLGRV